MEVPILSGQSSSSSASTASWIYPSRGPSCAARSSPSPSPTPATTSRASEGKPRVAYFLPGQGLRAGDSPHAIVTSAERNGEYDHRVMIHRETARALVRKDLAVEVTWEDTGKTRPGPHAVSQDLEPAHFTGEHARVAQRA
jgi:hypothetical protein